MNTGNSDWFFCFYHRFELPHELVIAVLNHMRKLCFRRNRICLALLINANVFSSIMLIDAPVSIILISTYVILTSVAGILNVEDSLHLYNCSCSLSLDSEDVTRGDALWICDFCD